MADKILCTFHWGCGRMGDLEGTFVTTQEELDKVIGKEIFFGEVLGKHSDIHAILGKDDVQIVSEDQEFIAKVETCGLVPVGHNPLNYVEE